MPEYKLRLIRKVAVIEIMGEEETVTCDNDAQIRLAAAAFINKHCPDQMDKAVDILDEKGKSVSGGTKRGDTEYGGFNPGF